MKPGVAWLLCSIPLLLFAGPGQTAHTDTDQPRHENARDRYYRLKLLREFYSREIYNYCTNKFEVELSIQLQNCMMQQKQLKDRIFKKAQRQLGQNSAVQQLFNDCLNVDPLAGMSRIGKCMDIRLDLRERIDQPVIEREIYERCQQKWRQHGTGAIRNCASHEANYFLDKGELLD